MVGDREGHHVTTAIGACESGVRAFYRQALRFADEVKRSIAHQGARQEACLAEDLEAIANAEHIAAAFGVGGQLLNNGRVTSNRAAPQIVSVRKAARNHDQIGIIGNSAVLMPNHDRCLASNFGEGILSVPVAIGTGKYDDGGFHAGPLAGSRDEWELIFTVDRDRMRLIGASMANIKTLACPFKTEA